MSSLILIFVLVSGVVQRILAKFQEAGLLYAVPQGCYDDWYWVYATLYEGRRRPARVVSNDFMRDHRAAFPDIKTFLRWRSQHIVYYQLSRSVVGYSARGEDYCLPEVELLLPGESSLCFCLSCTV